MTDTRNPTQDLGKLRKADLIDLLKDHYINLVESVEQYDGCDEGKIEFLRDVGVPDDFIAETFDLRPPVPNSIVITVAIDVDDDYAANPEDLRAEIIDALDQQEFVSGTSAYVVAMERSDRSSASLSRNVGAPTWMDLPERFS